MKAIILTLLIASTASAQTLTIIKPCSNQVAYSKTIDLDKEISVGEFTVKNLLEDQVIFQGTERGINSIYNTPVSLDAMEVISDTEMFAYGWCYKVNGFEPNLYPHEFTIKQNDQVVWWFGYAHYKDGNWITQCDPSHLRAHSQFCKALEY